MHKLEEGNFHYVGVVVICCLFNVYLNTVACSSYMFLIICLLLCFPFLLI